MGYYKDRWREQSPWIKIPAYTVLGVGAAVLFGLLFGMVVVWLWNGLMPALFGLPEITFWQGVGLFILAKLLFGGLSSSHSDSSKSGKGDRPKRSWSFEYDSDNPPHRPPFGCPPPEHDPHGPMGPGPGDHAPMEHGPKDRPAPKPDFHGWRYYDEWWESQGKASFDQYVDGMRPTPPPETPPEQSPETE